MDTGPALGDSLGPSLHLCGALQIVISNLLNPEANTDTA